MIIERNTIIGNLRILSVANESPNIQTRKWRAECLSCHRTIEISYSGIKTRRVKDTIHCRNCNPNGAGALSSHKPGMEIAGVLILRKRARRSKKSDMGKKSWDVQCTKCGYQFARNSNRLRHYDEKGESVCPKCNGEHARREAERLLVTPPQQEEPPIDGLIHRSPRLSGRPAGAQMPSWWIGAVGVAAGL